ncbi:MAG: bifunctional serine/threonine-protein kinase/formylglycine-generating enzyme family protein [Pseudomonadota bacterium]
MSNALSHAQALPVGTRIGEYTLGAVLGDGAFGITYSADDASGQPVAIKEFFAQGLSARLPDGSVGPISESRAADVEARTESFLEEASLLAGLSHPNVVSVRDRFSANGTAYYVMARYDGAPLKTLLDAGVPLSAEAVTGLLDPMLDALAYIHCNGVFHRDITPSNIIVQPNGVAPVLSDFGAAKTGSGEGTVLQTRIGTERYRAPEQISERGNIGPWTDIYGLSATLFHAITGQAPSDGVTRQSALFDAQPDPLRRLVEDAALVERQGSLRLAGIDAGLAVRYSERPQSIDAWQEVFAGISAPPVRRPAPAAPLAKPAPNPASQPAATSTSYPAYTPEPERTPWGRFVLGGGLLAAILGAGVWLVANTVTPEPKPPTPGPETVDAAPEPTGEPSLLSDNEAWVRALEQDTLEGYREYLSAFPNGRHEESAREEIARYDRDAWATAERRNTVAGYEDYLAGFPDGLFASQARERISQIEQAEEAAREDAAERARQESADWERAARENTVGSYQAYLDKHPTGPNAGEARSRLAGLQASAADTAAWRQAEALNTVAAYEQYLTSFPRGRFTLQAQAAIDALRPRPGRTFQDCPQCPSMVTLPSGTAQLGAPDSDAEAVPAEKPQRPVTFADFFAISVSEVTFAQFDACVADGGCSGRPGDNGWGRGNRPVINVSWDDAQAYTAWLSSKSGHAYSLPSEAQWEYAARGGEAGVYPGGSATALCAFANGANSESGLPWSNSACADPAPDRTLPAGMLAANRFGVKDMLGNVAEWTLDCNTLNLRDAPGDGAADMRGSCGQRAVRGGSWFSGPTDLRFTARLMQRRGDSNDFTGIRVVRKVDAG